MNYPRWFKRLNQRNYPRGTGEPGGTCRYDWRVWKSQRPKLSPWRIFDNGLNDVTTRELLTARQTAARLGLPYRTLHRLVCAGTLRPDAKAGRMALFDQGKLARVVSALRARLTFPAYQRALMRLNRASEK